ncbi:MAG: phosphotransferase [Pseudomonadota bacterium]
MASRLVRNAIYRLIPPVFARVKGFALQAENDLQHSFSILVCAKAGNAILIHRDQARVLKTGDASINENVLRLRQRLSKHIASPSFEVLEDSAGLLETFVSGSVFTALSAGRRAEIFKHLLDRYTSLSQEAHADSPQDYWRDAIGYAMTLPLPSSTRDALRAFSASHIQQLQRLSFTPSHGDLSGLNIIDSSDGPMVIDLEECLYLPTFFDLYFLAHQEALKGRQDIWALINRDEIWSQMSHVLQVRLTWREWLVAMFACELYEWQKKRGATTLNAPILLNWWAPIEQLETVAGRMEMQGGVV